MSPHSLSFPTSILSKLLLIGLLAAGSSGCAFLPEISHEPQFHNPFPQLQRVAILPFANQSDDPTVDGLEIANYYRTELQSIPGFEVMPVGVVDQFLKDNQIPLDHQTDFTSLAKALGVDAVVIGSVTDFESFYPPRMGLAVNWYAANRGFHPIPPGFGLPWGTPEEENIPDSLVFEAEFALARRQLETQSPNDPTAAAPIITSSNPDFRLVNQDSDEPVASSEMLPAPYPEPNGLPESDLSPDSNAPLDSVVGGNAGAGGVPWGDGSLAPGLPPNWPDPRGFIPDPPSPLPPDFEPQYGPIMQLVRQYDGADGDLTAKLENYHSFRDDGRIGGWQGYLTRTRDFQRFCCYLHITEMLTARGGGSETRVVWRWPFDRYQE